MAIKFEDDKGDKGGRPTKKAMERVEVGAEEPTTPGAELPFGKPTRPDKKGRRK